MDIEKQLRETDFSRFSKIKDRLLADILSSQQPLDDELDSEELDSIAAAGSIYLQHNRNEGE